MCYSKESVDIALEQSIQSGHSGFLVCANGAEGNGGAGDNAQDITPFVAGTG